MSRIREKFGELKRSGRGGFIPFITAGDPDLATTERLLIELAKRERHHRVGRAVQRSGRGWGSDSARV
jgi:Tryptophan synthase alpha chain